MKIVGYLLIFFKLLIIFSIATLFPPSILTDMDAKLNNVDKVVIRFDNTSLWGFELITFSIYCK